MESDTEKKLELLNILKDLFIEESIGDAFDKELKNFLENINVDRCSKIIENFYQTNIKKNEFKVKKIKFNNDIMHQSKLVNYFNGDYSETKIEKD